MRLDVALAVLLFGGGLSAARAEAISRFDEREAFFETRIRPVLVATCVKCHGGTKSENSLRVDRRESLLKGGDSGPAIVPGDPGKSLLIRALRYGDDPKMPPAKKLPEAVVADFERWIRDGATWPAHSAKDLAKSDDRDSRHSHWAFQPVRKVDPPRDASGWSAGAIDCFIRAKQNSLGLKPGAAASRRTLLRRAYFDLIGLPPTPKQVEAFLADKSPEAFSNVVETLLASPQYGERWGRYWMDVVRYADTAGDNADYPVPEARLYRDYIIDAFNNDKPYDQFVREQIAGDILAQQGPAEKYSERVVATGFLALSRRYATAPYELWHLTLEDTIDTVGRAYLGMTLRCARCHDHKFDPIATRDYYALYGVFASTQFPYAGSEEFQSMKFGRRAFAALVPTVAATPAIKSYAAEMSRLKHDVSQLEGCKPRNHAISAKLSAVEARLQLLERRGSPDTLPVAYAVSEGPITDADIQVHGEPSQPGAKVPRGAPRFLSGCEAPPPGRHESGRLELADWLTSPRNPLTARVIVNRVWQHHFGRGIVATPSNFGTRGAPPSHPELLDWLTSSFTEHGWSIKSLHRLIMQSKTYQLASDANSTDEAIDPNNQWYWRFNRQRLDAEAIRDAMLDVSGELDFSRPGPHPFPPIREWHWTQHFPFKADYPSNHRSVYLMTQRLHRHPFLGLFDGPDTNTTTDVRPTSTVPLQALYLMNDNFMRDTAGEFAGRLCHDANAPQTRIARAHELAFGRPALPQEIKQACDYVTSYAREASHAGLSPRKAESAAWLSYARILLDSNEFVYID